MDGGRFKDEDGVQREWIEKTSRGTLPGTAADASCVLVGLCVT